MLFMSIEEFEQSIFARDPHETDDEIAPGVRVARRQVLRFAALGLGAATLSGRVTNGQAAPRQDSSQYRVPKQLSIDFGTWVDEVRPLARQIVARDGPDEEAYLRAVSEQLARVDPIPDLSRKPFFVGEKRHQTYDMTLYYPPLLVSHIILNPGARIDLHDHRNCNGVLLTLQGRARLRNFEHFERDEVPSDGEEFTIRQTSSIVLEPGDLSTLSRKRDNLHEVASDDVETHLLDVFTCFRKDARSHEVTFDDKPIDERKKLYRAYWKKPG